MKTKYIFWAVIGILTICFIYLLLMPNHSKAKGRDAPVQNKPTIPADGQIQEIAAGETSGNTPVQGGGSVISDLLFNSQFAAFLKKDHTIKY